MSNVKREAGFPTHGGRWLVQTNYDTLMTYHSTENKGRNHTNFPETWKGGRRTFEMAEHMYSNLHRLSIVSITVKIISLWTAAGETYVGPVNLLYIIMFKIRKIKPNSSSVRQKLKSFHGDCSSQCPTTVIIPWQCCWNTVARWPNATHESNGPPKVLRLATNEFFVFCKKYFGRKVDRQLRRCIDIISMV